MSEGESRMIEQSSEDIPVVNLSTEMPLLDLIITFFKLFIYNESFDILQSIGVHCLACVIDTNILLKDICRTVRRQEKTGLIRAAQTGIVRFYASTIVRDEVPEKIQIKHNEFHIDQDIGIATWEQIYAPLIAFIDPKDISKLSKEVTTLQLRDIDDAPTGQIIELIQPSAVFSEDQDLERFITVPSDIWAKLACALRDYSESNIKEVAVIIGGGITIHISLGLLNSLLQLMLAINRKILIALAIGLGIALTIPPSRRFVVRQGQLLFDTLLNEHVYDFAKKFGRFLVENHRTKEKAEKFIALYERPKSRPKKALEYITLILSVTPIPISAQRIVEQMIELDYVPRGKQPIRYVRHLLRNYPNLFEETTTRKWRLRSHG